MKNLVWFLLLFPVLLMATATVPNISPNGFYTPGSAAIGKSSAANVAAALEVASTTKGLLIPKMTTTQQNAIAAPVEGLLIYNTTTGTLNIYTSGVWGGVTGGGVNTALSNLTFPTDINQDLVGNTGSTWFITTADSGVASTKGIVVRAGDSTAGSGGSATLNGGDGTVNGGDVSIFGGTSNVGGNGGTVQITAGSKSGAGTAGDVRISIPSGGKFRILNSGAAPSVGQTLVTTSTSGDAYWATLSLTSLTGTLPIAKGGTAVTSVTTSPTASSFAGWDANSNLSANNFLFGYATTTTSGGTLTLTAASAHQQYFTGSSTHTVVMPVTSTLALGEDFKIANFSTGAVLIQSSGGNTIVSLPAAINTLSDGTVAYVTVTSTSGTTASSWSVDFYYPKATAATANSFALRDSSGDLFATVFHGSGASLTSIPLTTGVTGVLPIANGGTNSATTLNNNRVMKSSGGAVVEATAITANRAVVSDANGIPVHATTTDTEIGYVNGVTSAIQTQINTKAPTAGPTFSGTITTPLTASRALATGASSELAVSATTATELGYVSGVTSAIQTQLNTISASSTTSQPYALVNVGISASISANTLIVALTQSDGSTNCSVGNPCTASFRSATATTASFTSVSFTAANSITLGTTDSIGSMASTAQDVYVYLVSDTTSEICLSGTIFDEGFVQSATALTAGAEVTRTTLYCTSAHTSKPIRLIGKVRATWSNPNWGTLANATIVPFNRVKTPTIQTFTSGTTQTYTTPSGVSYIKVRMVGGGGGGAGSGTTNGTAATNGGDSTFACGSQTLTANGGIKGTRDGDGALGGAASLGTGPIGTALGGGQGSPGAAQGTSPLTSIPGGSGGNSAFGGGGSGGSFGGAGSGGGIAATANTGGGGGGGLQDLTTSGQSGAGGGSGGFIDAIITVPAATCTYSVGTAGSAGGSGTSGKTGGAGAAGYIEVTEYYQ